MYNSCAANNVKWQLRRLVRTLEINAKYIGHAVHSAAGVGHELRLHVSDLVVTHVDPAETGEAAEVAIRQRHQAVVRSEQLLQRR